MAGYRPYPERKAISTGSSSAQSTTGSRLAPSYVPNPERRPQPAPAKPAPKSMSTNDMIGLPGALNPPGQMSSYYSALLGGALRSGEAVANAQRRAVDARLNDMGMGSSSETGMFYGDIAREQALGAQQAATSVMGLKYANLQDALQFERQKYLTRLQADVAQDRTPWWQRVLQLGGGVAGQYLAWQTQKEYNKGQEKKEG